MNRIALLLGTATLGTILSGCTKEPDSSEMKAPPPSPGAVAPPVVPNGVKGGPGDLKPGIGKPGERPPGT